MAEWYGWFWFVGLFGVIFWCSHQLRRIVVEVGLLLTGSRRVGIILYSLVFLVGTIIHELSHFLVASILMVPTGKFSIFAEKTDDERVKLGSLEVAKTDFLRGSLVGVAPLLVGLLVMVLLARELNAILVIEGRLTFERLVAMFTSVEISVKNGLLLYLVWSVGNTMFVSREDRRYLPGVILLGAVVLGLIGFLGYWQGFSQMIGGGFLKVVWYLVPILVIFVLVDLLMLFLFAGLRSLTAAVTGKRLVIGEW